MSELKIELIKLLKFPIAGLTIIVVALSLGVNMGNLKEFGPTGMKFFHPGEMIHTKKKKEIVTSNNLDVSLPITSKKIIDSVSKTKYSDKPVSTGWLYLGTYKNGSWNDRLIEISEFMIPEINKSYVVVADTINVRVDKPRFPFYALKNRVGFANKDDLLKIIDIDSNLGKNRVWAKVEVYSKVEES